jgi:hypothetical protein
VRIKVGTFNVFNLVNAGVKYYNKPAYSKPDFNAKSKWIAAQLKRMEPQIVGFQEVFHEDALKHVAKLSGLFEPDSVIAPSADGTGPSVGLATTLPIVKQWDPIKKFPKNSRLSINGKKVPIKSFERPVLKVDLQLDDSHTVTVFVAHLKSKRPIIDTDNGEDDDDFTTRAVGEARSLIVRAAEAAALRALLVKEMQDNDQPVIVIGDLNDAVHSVSTQIVAGSPPWQFLPIDDKRKIWDVLLYNTSEIQSRQSERDVTYSYVYNGNYHTIDHIFVSQEFHRLNPSRIGKVEFVRFFNDHIVDGTLSSDNSGRIESDHGQIVATLRLKEDSND